ncbi:hypothetical protein [Gottfriedia solisilvae]|uniref:Uncharacterized protein n=1 Tax=Gottfriedia solisilvae TaxID=1516104 RepID=A0A8J3AK85_9BACI|nr:hypothetical protein [Gottfriedia solisilvae]GGI14340.1 hypothetical protein GCM10007380_22450 [Gottfriedia solisilvae]
MNQITLAEALNIRHILSKRIRELIEELEENSSVEVEKGQPLPTLARNMTQIESDLAKVRADFRKLDYLMQKANIENTITIENMELSITEAIEFAKQLRAEVQSAKEFASKKERIQPMYGTDSIIVEKLYFNPEDYRQKALKLERKATRLSGLIDAKNFSINIPFDGRDYF